MCYDPHSPGKITTQIWIEAENYPDEKFYFYDVFSFTSKCERGDCNSRYPAHKQYIKFPVRKVVSVNDSSTFPCLAEALAQREALTCNTIKHDGPKSSNFPLQIAMQNYFFSFRWNGKFYNFS